MKAVKMTVFSAEAKKVYRNSVIRVTAATLFLVCVISALFAVRTEKANGYTADEINAEYAAQTAVFINNAEKSLRELKRLGVSGNSYACEYYEKIIKVYTESRNTVRIRSDGSDGWNGVLNSEPVLILSLLGAAIIGAVSVLEEKRTGAAALLSTTVNGRGKTKVAKAAVVIISSVLLCLFISLAYAAVFLLSGRLSSGAANLQCAEDFMYSQYDVTLYGAFALLCARRALTCAVCGCVFSFIASFLSSYALTFGAGAALLAAEFAVFNINFKAVDIFAQNVNVFAYGGSYMLKRYYSARIFGETDSRYVFAVISVMIIGGYLLYAALSGISPASRQRKPRDAKKQKDARRSGDHTLFVWELRKRLLSVGVLVFVAVGVCAKVYTSYRVLNVKATMNEVFYREYCEKYSEMSIEDAIRAVRAEAARIEKGVGLKNTADELKAEGEITDAEYEDMMFEYGYCRARIDASKRCVERIPYLMKAEGDNVRFLYDTPADKFLSLDADVILIILLSLILSPSFSSEYELRTSQLILISRNGRGRTFSAKLLSSLFITTLLFIPFSGIELIFAAVNGAFTAPAASILSLESAAGSVINVSIAAYTAVMYALRYAAYVSFSAVTLSLSELTGKTSAAAALSMSFAMLPYAVRILSGRAFPADISAVLSGSVVLLGKDAPAPYLVFIAAAALTAAAYASYVRTGKKPRIE